jgi:hypothetical protein
MKDGQAILLPSAIGAQVVVVVNSRLEPVDETRARPAIEQFLLNDAKRKLIESDMKAMRAASKIEYVGKFADNAASQPAPSASAVSPTLSEAPKATGLSPAEINKGMGLK